MKLNFTKTLLIFLLPIGIAYGAATENTEPNRKVLRTFRGQVLYITAFNAFLNVGAKEGVTVGSEIRTMRNGRPRGICVVELVSDHTSVCRARQVQQGDLVVIQGWVERDWTSPDLILSSGDRTTIVNGIRDPYFSRVTYKHKADLFNNASTLPVTGTAGHDTWYPTTGDAYHRENFGLSVSRAEVAKNLYASLDLSVWAWTKRPSTARFWSNRSVQPFVSEASVLYDDPRSPLHLEAGRIRSYQIRGVAMLDGVTAGYRVSQINGEVGAYLGTTPELVILAPSFDHWQFGVYGSQDFYVNREYFVRDSLRFGFHNTADFGSRFESEASISAGWVKHFDVDLGAQMGLFGGTLSGATLDSAHIDLGFFTPTDLRILLSGRIIKHLPQEESLFGVPGTRHADTSFIWEGVPGMRISLIGGASQEESPSSIHRLYAGPEVQWLLLPAPLSNFTIYFQEEFGWLRGRMAFLQPTFSWNDRYRSILRVSYSQDLRDGETFTQYGGYFNFSARINDWLSSRLFVQYLAGSGPTGIVGGLDLTGQI